MTTPLRLQTLGDLLLFAPDGVILLRRRIDLALLALVADRAPSAVKRVELQTLFWGERSQEKSRNSLRQVILRLRQACGDAIQVSETTIRVADGAIDADVRRFTEAARAGQWRHATEVWTGPFLPGCDDIGIDGFRTWLDAERERLRRLLVYCYERAVEERPAGEPDGSQLPLVSAWARDFPLEAAPHRHLVEELCDAGRVAEADAVRGAFIRRLEEEEEDSPGAAWLASVEGAILRARDAERQGASAPAPPRPTGVTNPPGADPATAAPTAPDAQRTTHTPRRSRRRWLVGVSVIAASTIAAFVVRSAKAEPKPMLPLAIGEITSTISRDSVRGFATLLTIDLARIGELNVISERRLSEAASRQQPQDLAVAARSVGAKEILEGVLSRRGNHTLRADLRRINLATGVTRAAYTVEASDLTELADLVTEQVARELGVTAQIVRREAVTGSIVGYRLYEQGLRAFNDGDVTAARRFFTGALAEDSLFAMAALYNALAIGGDGSDEYFARAARLAQRTSDRERLLISATWGRRMSDPRVLAWAETLLTRYPSETDAHLLYAQEMLGLNNPVASLAHFRIVVEMDSLNRGARPRCRACDGLMGMMEAYSRLDSVQAEEHLAQILVRWQPRVSDAWIRLSGVLGRQRRYTEAHAAIDSATRYSSDGAAPLEHTVWWFRTNQFGEIDRSWRELERSAKPDVRMSALWTGVISLRTQGRYHEALAAARRYRRESIGRGQGMDPSLGAAMPEALTLMEGGDPRRAAALFDSIARVRQPEFPSRRGAHRAMYWTHAAGAYSVAGDTIPLRLLEDSVRVNGQLATSRSKALHHYVRGLRLAGALRHDEAATEYSKALVDPRGMYVRIYLESARSLLAAGKPRAAIVPLTIALEGPTSASGLYATRSELQELLGLAYERAGRPDSAATQYRLVAQAWRNADPPMVRRRTVVERRLEALTR